MKKNITKINTHKMKPILILISIGMVFLIVLMSYKYKQCVESGVIICLTSKEFKSSSSGISFRHPSFFPISQFDEKWEFEQAKNTFAWEDFIDFTSEAYFSGGGNRLGSIKISSISGEKNIEELSVKLSKQTNILGNGIVEPDAPITEKVIIGSNIEALKVTPKTSPDKFGDLGSSYVFFSNGLRYTIYFNYDEYHHKLPKEDYEKGYKLILKTIKLN